jgi:hypothetical protein
MHVLCGLVPVKATLSVMEGLPGNPTSSHLEPYFLNQTEIIGAMELRRKLQVGRNKEYVSKDWRT